MQEPGDRGGYLDSVIVIFLFAAFLLLPPFFTFWATPGRAWYLPYLIWLGLILLIVLVHAMRDRDEL